MDDATGAPVSDAIVAATWSGDIHGIVDSSSLCYHVEVAQTDARGRFVIPAWKRTNLSAREQAVSEKKRIFYLYKEGYGEYNGLTMQPDKDNVIHVRRYAPSVVVEDMDWRGVKSMKTYSGAERRVAYLAVSGATSCGYEDGSVAQADLLAQRMCAERNSLLKQLGRATERCGRSFSRNREYGDEDAAKEMARRAMSVVCAGMAKPEEHSCCYEMADPSRIPLLAEQVSKAGMQFTLKDGKVCVRYWDRTKVEAMASAIP